MLPGHVFTLANRSMKKPLLVAASVALSVGVLLGSAPAFADPATAILGMPHDTSDPNDWMVKYLGTSDDWEAARSYTNGVLDITDYVQAQTPVPADYAWATGTPWISPAQDTYGPQGYYSYVTTINDSMFTSVNPTLAFNGLSIHFSVDDRAYAFVINGVIYDGFTAQTQDSYRWYEDLFIPSNGNIAWNVGGDNTVEIIVHNGNGPTGLSATLQASYAPIPEPETWAMLLGGLGIVGVVTRRRRIKTSM